MIEVYADGSCLGNGKEKACGGWAFVVLSDGKHIYHSYGAENHTTNNRMEITAVIEALIFLYTKMSHVKKVKIYSDSSYVCNAFSQHWIEKWRMSGWKTKSGKEVKNKRLWEALSYWNAHYETEYCHVKGHSGNKWNEKCDKLAREAAGARRNGLC